MSALNDIEAITDGLGSPFWTLYHAHVTQEWGPSGIAFQQMYQQGIQEKNWEKVVAASEIQKAMRAALDWPAQRLSGLKAQGLKELVEIRSRGGV